jgi:class 3 adenylate cyclase/tetratricopeptide (TPR) repeat protein
MLGAKAHLLQCVAQKGDEVRCSGCHSDNPESNRFCDRCGAPLSRLCPDCAYENRADARFCGGCGKPLDRAATAGAPSGGAALPGPSPRRGLSIADYTPQHLAARILSSRLTLAGERKQVTVLFADIRGSTELIQGLDPEKALERLDPGLKVMIDSVHRYEGAVSRVQGDGIMALFGAPIAHEDHAVRACLAARAMLDGIAKLDGNPLRIRVGLNSGEVVVRSIGNDLSLEYDAIGSTVHLASRMEQAASPGTACMAASTLRLASGFVEVRALGLRELKGLPGPVEIFELAGIAGRARWDVRAAAGALTRFVGREVELALLGGDLKRAKAGRGQVVAVAGEPGVGKSRLAHEFLQSAPLADWTVLRSGAMPHDRDTPFLAVAELLRSWLGVGERDGQAEIARKLSRLVAEIDGQLIATLAPLKSLLDLPTEDAEWERLDPPERRSRIRDALRLLMLKAASLKPLVLVAEDLHWIDAESEAVLNALVDGLGGARLLLVVTYRPEYRHGWAGRGYYSLVRVDPLEAEAADELLRSLIGEAEGLESLRSRLIARSEGTPLFLEEMVRALLETGILRREGERLRLTRGVDEVEIPDSVQAVLAARIDRLSAANRGVLQIASAIGKDVPLNLLQAVAEMPPEQLRARLAELQEAEFLYEINLATGTEYTFKHALTHDVAYESMLLTRRRELHARVMLAIESVYPDRLDEFTERLADHALKGEAWAKAVDYCAKAGRRANARSAHREAIADFRRALIALAHLPSERANVDRAIDIRLGLRVALAAAGEHVEIRKVLEEAEALAKKIENRRQLALINISKCTILTILGPLEEGVRAGEMGCAIADELNDESSIVGASYALGQAYWYRGDFGRASEVLSRIAPKLTGASRLRYAGTTGTGSVLCLGCLGNTHSFVGAFSDAKAANAEAAAIADETNRPYDLAYSRIALGLMELTLGELDGAIRTLETALAFCRASEIRLLEPATARYLGRAYALAGRSEQALPLLEEAVARSNALALAALQAWCGSSLALAHLLAGQWRPAERVANAALETAQRHGYQPVSVLALRTLALTHARRTASDLARAEGRCLEALALAEAIGMRPEIAHCRRDLAEIHSLAGRTAESQRELGAALDLYRHLGMSAFAARVGAEGGQVLGALAIGRGPDQARL